MLNINQVQADLKSISNNTRVITANAEKKRRVRIQKKNTRTLASIFLYPLIILSLSFVSLGIIVRLCYILNNVQHNKPILSVPEQNSNKY